MSAASEIRDAIAWKRKALIGVKDRKKRIRMEQDVSAMQARLDAMPTVEVRTAAEAVIARRNLAAAMSGQDRTASQDRRESEVRDG